MHELPANPSHRQALLAAHGTEGGRAEREEGGDYTTDEGKDIREEGWGEEGWGDATTGFSGNGSSASGVSTTGDNESLMESADRTSGATEDREEWKNVTQSRIRRGGRKARARRQGACSQRTGDEDGTTTATHNTQGDGTDADRRQCTWDRDGTDGAKTLPLAADGSERGGNREAFGGRRRGMV